MTAHDPQLVSQGDLPWHFKRRADDTENADADYAENDEADDEASDAPDYSFADAVADEEEGVNPFAIAVVAAALVIGIGVGAGATALLMSSHRPPTVAVSRAPPPPRPAPPAIAPSPPPVEAAAPAPAPAAKPASPRAHRPAAAPAPLATACGASGGPRETLICAWPAIAAADREMRGAYQRALDVGVERSSLQASQDRWLVTSDMAARRSAADLAAAYRSRIGELNALAASEPPR
jgi:uncharacterized protein YecT (DUF1311 family)